MGLPPVDGRGWSRPNASRPGPGGVLGGVCLGLRAIVLYPIVVAVRDVIANLLSLQHLEMRGKRLTPADKDTITR